MDMSLKIPPLLLSLIVLVLMGAVQWATIDFGWVTLALGGWLTGGALIVLGLGVMVTGAWQFRRQGTTLDPRDPSRTHHVVDDGIYRFTRNPMYLGMAIALAGVAVGVSNLLCLLCVPAFCAYIHRWQIKPEEHWLTRRFGDDYLAYMAKVRRWI